MAELDTPNTIAVHLNGARDEVIDALVKLAPTLDANLDAVRALLFALSDIEAIGRELDDVSPPALAERITRSGGRVVVPFPSGDAEVPQ